MSTQTLLTGIVLIALGVGGYVASGAASVTALIPAFIGAALALLGVLGRREALRRHAMHLAMVVALLAIVGTFGGVTDLIAWLGGTLLCVMLLVGGIRTFLAARRSR
jgi:hypothetical protein